MQRPPEGAEEVIDMSMQAESTRSRAGTLDRSAEERAALQAVLQSRVFQARPRLVRLLEYICERYFDGEADGLKEYSIATDVFRRPDSFDQATDSIVRVEVFRLRKKLREFYESEGADQSIEIVIAPGHYRPEFFDRAPRATHQSFPPALTAATDDATHSLGFHAAEESQAAAIHGDVHPEGRVPRRFLTRPAILTTTVLLALAGVVAAIFFWPGHLRPPVTAALSESLTTSAALSLPGPEVRIRCGYSRPIFKDDEGNVWSGDRFYSGGFSVDLPNQHIARTRNPELYLTARSGVFSYRIPLASGAWELRLHFAETTYSPASTLGGGENSRVFDVRLNGQPLLSQFDIVSDAGANTADVRVFRDVAPDRDGYLHLDFNGSLGLPMINAIEIVPGAPHQLRPIRMVAQNTFFVDKSGNLWMPDAYFSSGQLASDKVAVDGTPEPGLFEGERYGNFTYALPVDRGTYRMTLYFSEKYWGVAAAQNDAAGKRVFDIFCNGYALTRGLDIAREAGPARALVKVYRGLRPNAQGKLIVSFVPEVNYASVDALEIEQE